MSAVEAQRRTLRQSLSDSWAIHIAKPQLFLIAGGGAVLMFLLGRATGSRDPLTGDLGRLLAFAPADRFTDISLAEGGWSRLLLLPGFLVRVAVVAAVVALSLDVPPRRAHVAKLALVYLAATLSILIPFVLGIAYLGQRAQAQEGSGGGFGLVILALFPLVLLLLAALSTPMVLQAAAGWRLRPLLADYRIWVLSALSLWLWASPTKRIDHLGDGAIAFFFALILVSIQSILLVAALVATSDRSRAVEVHPKSKVVSTTGAVSSA